MEPPAKRMRLLGPVTNAHSVVNHLEQTPSNHDTQPQNHFEVPNPTRTRELSDFRRRSLDRRALPVRRDAGILLYPRVPDVTVTANVVNIAVVDSSDQTSTTQVPAPTTDVTVAIPNQGVVTVSGSAPVTSGVGSILSGVTQSLLPSDSSGISSLSSLITSTLSGNATTDRTVTVTSTSTLEIGFRNGTAFRTSTFTGTDSTYKTVTIDGVTSTINIDTSGTNSRTYVFGDVSSSTTLPSTSTGYSAAVITPTPTTASSGSATSTDSSSGGGSGVVLTPQQQQVVGGVVGGVAGVALVLAALLYFLKWYRQHLKAQGRLPEQIAHRQLQNGDDHDFNMPPPMSQSAKPSLLPITAFKQSLQKLRPNSTYTLTSNSTEGSSLPAESDRGFQRVSGRQIPSVLLTGGDGYGDESPASPPSEYSSYSRSRGVSQTSSFRDSNNSASPFLIPGNIQNRSHTSPFADPPNEGSTANLSIPGSQTSARDFALVDGSRPQLNLHAGGLAALTPKRQSDTNVTIRPSPARMPMTASPTNSSLKLPMHTPPLMSGDIPEMPPLRPPPQGNSSKSSDGTLSVHRSMGQRSMSSFSVRSSTSTGGRFKENI